jgi:hypothetical protein
VAMSPKRGVTVPETGWGKVFWMSFISCHPESRGSDPRLSEVKSRGCPSPTRALRFASLRLRSGQALRSAPVEMTGTALI